MFYLTKTATNRHNAKRHILEKSYNRADIENYIYINDLVTDNEYLYEVYNGKWQLLEQVNITAF